MSGNSRSGAGPCDHASPVRLTTLKFADILRANGRLIQAKGTYVFTRWIRTQLEQLSKDIGEFIQGK